MISYDCRLSVPIDFTGVCLITSWNAICYFKDGSFHRTDGPAIEWSDGDRDWYVNGILHRIDGPAIEYKAEDGGNGWLVNGIEYSKEEFDSLPQVIMYKEGLEIFT